ncbi:DUF4232 domain-containing protein [Streptomyces cinnabarinus]|uniref:DUF4232 domain-containing protein n=1 Tax=Streptomyces cinnabarinus TaxID=67287 RepID=A0ABY7KMP0_9ACTN|nr:DUF4232 domain-containing protein [Streptomyces cinnabarinus]WAZ25858.1 DUF4232 domain-containing protein [Streptomyces cinnabarinus]
MANTSSSPHRTALLASAVALLGALTACGGTDGTTTAPRPTTPTTHDRTTSPPGTEVSPGEQSTPTRPAASPSPAGAAAPSSRCRTAELRAEVGRMDPGAGQRNFPIVLTNASARTCTVYGYPGAAFVDASGRQLGPDPERAPGKPSRVTLAPGDSAWAGLSYASPEISGARTARPAGLLVTPPDEREPIEVDWTAGAVPVSGNASTVRLTVFAPGSGP